VNASEPRDDRLRQVFLAYSDRVYAYTLRHVDRDRAQDVIAEVFMVAWRRIEDMPPEPLPWLLVIARNCLRSRRRSDTRQHRLAMELATQAVVATARGAEDVAVERNTMMSALGQLSELERESLFLIAWDGLSSAEAAEVAGCSRATFDVRVCRARARLQQLLDSKPERPRPRTTTRPAPTPRGDPA
jgi:RNA polymerase sigma factor (sigma-70 family)